MRTFFIAVLALFLLTIVVPPQAQAKKALPKFTSKSTTVKKPAAGLAKGVTVQVQLRNDRRGIIAKFSNPEIASNVSYTLTYNSRGVQEGAGGSLTDLSGAQVRELLFATCSSGVCRYHTNIKNAQFVVTTTLQDGRKVRKIFKIKV